ncbi:hypothetical protein, conserved [Eimeria brunetti]|uniref:Chromo domain-containing protein n=1 Tax=Eimeria brunetti TaxID=51314 RepID=U6LW30_9EIME|nr:hypothetical protein, conserved [Eimeria brunetti]
MPNTIAYEWSQTAADISLRLRIPSLKADLRQRQRDRQLSVTVAKCYLRVCWHPWLLEIDLWGDVAFRSATVTPGVDCLTIIVPKVEEGLWGSLTAASNPQLLHNIRERRRAALAEHAEWQEQLQQQRIAAREARKQQQQKHVWRQQQEQREWHQRQKEIQVQEVLRQLPEESRPPAKCGETQDASPRPLVNDQTWGHKLQGPSESESKKNEWSSKEGRQQPQERVEPSVAAAIGKDSCRNGTMGEEKNTVVDCDSRASTLYINKETTFETPVSALAAQNEDCMEQNSFPGGCSIDLDAFPCKDLVGAPTHAQLAVTHVQAVNPAPSMTIKVSFAAKRPNNLPARGPLAPPLPQTDPDLGKQICTREKPEDLSKLQEASPTWLHSKATRLLIGGDAAAAEETYNIILELSQRQSLHRLVCIKALCGRSLARLASGANKKALLDCNEAITLLQELQQQEDIAAAAAGQPLEKGPLQAELSHLQRVLLSRRAAVFLKLDALDDGFQMYGAADSAAKSLEELLQLQPSQPPSTVDHMDRGDNECLDEQRAAVYTDLHHIRRLQQMRKAKEEADTVLRFALTTQQGRRMSARLQAAVLATADDHTSFPWAGAAATVLANIAFALTHLREYSLVSAAESALTAAETLIQHAEEGLKVQNIHAQQSPEPPREKEAQVEGGRLSASRCTTKPPDSLPTHGSALNLRILYRRDKPRPQDMLEPEGWDPIQGEPQASEAEYEVEHLLDNRGEGRNEEFLVKWKGFPEGAATWEPVSNLTNCRNLVRAY